MSRIDFFEQSAHGLILVHVNFRSTDQIKLGQYLDIGDRKIVQQIYLSQVCEVASYSPYFTDCIKIANHSKDCSVN